METKKYPNILIIGTCPYTKNGPTRSFETYFGSWPSNNLAQFFSQEIIPTERQCSTLFRITDRELVKNRFNSFAVGTIFDDRFLSTQTTAPSKIGKTSIWKLMVNLVSRHKSPFTHMIRKRIWKEELWNTAKFNNWLESFSPNVVFCSFSNDFFILEISEYVSHKFSIPIICAIDDDYLFGRSFLASPCSLIYKQKYSKLAKRVIKDSSSLIFISDKMKTKYCKALNVSGTTMYLSSELQPKMLSPTIPSNISYFGNLRLDRYKSLCDIASQLEIINPQLFIDVYSSEHSKKILSAFAKFKNIRFHGFVPYQKLTKIMMDSDILLICEAQRGKFVQEVAYSLSTKVADSVSSGIPIFAYGSKNAGAIDFLLQKNLACVATNPNELGEKLKRILNDASYRKELSAKCLAFAKPNFNHDLNNQKFYELVTRL